MIKNKKKHSQLTKAKRQELEILADKGYTEKEIAQVLNL